MIPSTTTFRAVRDLAAVTAAAVFAASAWAAGLHEEGFILDAPTWQFEVARVPSPDWPVDNWYRLTPSRKTVDVRRATPSEAEGKDPQGALYVRVPGTRLVEGARMKQRFAGDGLRPRVGKEYVMALGESRYSFIVTSDRDGTRWDLNYAGQTYSYLLGLPAAENMIHAIADFDGDGLPDFLVEVGDDTFLLLSTRARPGHNDPAAQLWALQTRG